MIDYTIVPVTYYKIVCKNKEVPYVYVGSTTDFKMRKDNHLHACNNENHSSYNLKLYKIIRLYDGFNNWEIQELETSMTGTYENRCLKEQEYINSYNNALNQRGALLLFNSKTYYIQNRNKIIERNRQYDKDNIDKVKLRRKQYAEAHSEENKLYYKNYYEKNKNHYLEKHICGCGGSYRVYDKSKHFKTKKHMNFENII
jgi:hypothetical protein